MLPYVDVLQVGARNMQNYHLLRGLGEVDKPVLLKRGMAATHRGVAAERRIHYGRRKLQSDSVRAREFARSIIICATRWILPRFR